MYFIFSGQTWVIKTLRDEMTCRNIYRSMILLWRSWGKVEETHIKDIRCESEVTICGQHSERLTIGSRTTNNEMTIIFRARMTRMTIGSLRSAQVISGRKETNKTFLNNRECYKKDNYGIVRPERSYCVMWKGNGQAHKIHVTHSIANTSVNSVKLTWPCDTNYRVENITYRSIADIWWWILELWSKVDSHLGMGKLKMYTTC